MPLTEIEPKGKTALLQEKIFYGTLKGLHEAGGILKRREAIAWIETNVVFTEWELAYATEESKYPRWLSNLSFHLVGLVKAKFMEKTKEGWKITSKGVDALEKSSPSELRDMAIQLYNEWSKEDKAMELATQSQTEGFDWIPLYKELALLLTQYEDRQDELISLLSRLKQEGLPALSMQVKDGEGIRVLLEEIDPFTFFGSFNRGLRIENRQEILKEVVNLFGAKNSVPENFDGIPRLNNQNSRFCHTVPPEYKKDVHTLWKLFKLALQDNPLDNQEFIDVLDDALSIQGIGTNITQGLFWIRPDVFISFDGINREYLDLTFNRKERSGKKYKELLDEVRDKYPGIPFTTISRNAWLSQQQTDPPDENTTVLPKKKQVNNYWLVGAWWDERKPQNQTKRFVDEGIWKNGYENKYAELVHRMQPGDKIAIKASATQKLDLPFDARGHTASKMIVKARGTILRNHGDGRTVDVEWEMDFKQRNWYFYTGRATIWRLQTEDTYKHKELLDKLIDFVWNDVPQDYEWFASRWWDTEIKEIEEEELLETAFTIDWPEYTIEDATHDIFMPAKDFSSIVDNLNRKKNVILQGPPGVGKTYLAKRLAYLLMGHKDQSRVEMIQFHQSYAYEDFIQGWRPTEDGGFSLRNGIFHTFCKAASLSDQKHVFIIDEINRGNLSRIFGELMMLIESDKRGPDFSIPLTYSKNGDDDFYVPKNVYVMGLMNTADRSLAMVDYALRRRFTFMTLKPQFESDSFQEHLRNRGGGKQLVAKIVNRMMRLNDEIALDTKNLGPGYVVGHSFFCPSSTEIVLDEGWYTTVINNEVAPLLYEYWFDDPNKVDSMVESLLE